MHHRLRYLHHWGLLLTLLLGLLLGWPTASYAQTDRPLTLGESVRGRLENAASVDTYRFQAQAGIQIRIRFTADVGLEPAARLEVDNREVWFGGSPGSNVVDSGNLTLESNNEYILQVRSANGRAGGYLLETARSNPGYQIGSGPQIQPGFPVWGRLPGPATGARHFFFAQSGQTAVISVRTGENLLGRVTLQAPDGLILWSERATTPNQTLSIPPLLLPMTGPYLVFVTAGGSNGGTYEISLALN
ncbi:MAG: hypothetical protein AB4911_16655 [Oscillochloridaceae bacterium umkhey_bin13]